ncbi:probable 37S ribosomal protein S28, mitochondrial [Zygosaccharomyces bailii]|nr:probable 37S ribosomal protein S28, mitochondrial [Zygosaccharomyces bailii]
MLCIRRCVKCDTKYVLSPLFSAARYFSSSSSLQGSKAIKFLKSQRKKQANLARQSELRNSMDSVDPVLGRESTPFVNRVMAELKEPGVLSHGYQTDEVERMIAAVESAQKEQLELSNLNAELIEPESSDSLQARREALLRILSMRNTDNKNSMKLALRLAREEFQRFPDDTGSSEVQAACMTIRIHNLVSHVKDHQKDHANTRVLRTLVQQRQRILRYLKKDNPERYYWTIQKLGLTDAVIAQEFNMDRRYMQDFKFFGDKILVRDSKKVAGQKRREMRKQRRVTNNVQL